MSVVIETKIYKVKEREPHSVSSEEVYDLYCYLRRKKLSSFDAIGLLTGALADEIFNEAKSRVDFEPGGEASKEEWQRCINEVLREVRDNAAKDLESKLTEVRENRLEDYLDC